MVMCGTPVGHPFFVENYIQAKVDALQGELDIVGGMGCTDEAMQLIRFCSSPRMGHWLRMVLPCNMRGAAGHWGCMVAQSGGR